MAKFTSARLADVNCEEIAVTKLLEAYEIGREGDNSVSQTSVYLHKKKVAFLRTCWRYDGMLVYLAVFFPIHIPFKFCARPLHSSLLSVYFFGRRYQFVNNRIVFVGNAERRDWFCCFALFYILFPETNSTKNKETRNKIYLLSFTCWVLISR